MTLVYRVIDFHCDFVFVKDYFVSQRMAPLKRPKNCPPKALPEPPDSYWLELQDYGTHVKI